VERWTKHLVCKLRVGSKVQLNEGGGIADRPPREYLQLGIVGQEACWLAAGYGKNRTRLATSLDHAGRWQSVGMKWAGKRSNGVSDYVSTCHGYPDTPYRHNSRAPNTTTDGRKKAMLAPRYTQTLFNKFFWIN
jgi:hypothetical protein